MEQEYAIALHTVIEKGMTPARAVRALYGALERHGRTKLLSRIARVYARYAERTAATRTTTLSVVSEKDTHAKKEALKALAASDIATQDVRVTEDKTLIGGWRTEGQGVVLDASYKRQLLDMYNSAVGKS